MSAKYVRIIIALVSIFAAVAVVWVRWTYWPPHGLLIPDDNIPLILAGVFTAAVIAGFGAAIPETRFWQRFLQGLAGILLLAFVTLPVDMRWVESAYYLIMPRPVIHQHLAGPIPGKPREERLVTIHANPIIERRGISISDKEGYELLVLRPAQGEVIEVICGLSFSPWYSSLPRDKELTFTVWQTKNVGWHTDDGREERISWDNSIETIRDGALLLYDARICPLHHVDMKRVEVPISYGLPSREFMDAYKDFSGGPGFVEGGCVSDGKEHTVMDYRCPECVAAYDKWAAQMRAKTKQLQGAEPEKS